MGLKGTQNVAIRRGVHQKEDTRDLREEVKEIRLEGKEARMEVSKGFVTSAASGVTAVASARTFSDLESPKSKRRLAASM